ncbi:ionotropic receptor 21a-like [Procambarus clarkii]|uniref:ionotropic receptor 21a-like n=1 Tax=Procambarus clarkii TaxID=6728 RepID=UPI0037434FC8
MVNPTIITSLPLVIVIQLLLSALLHQSGATTLEPSTGDAAGAATGIGWALLEVLGRSSRPSCSLLVLTDPTSSPSDIIKELIEADWPLGMVLLQVVLREANFTSQALALTRLIRYARQIRLLYPCVSLVVLSDDPAFWSTFGELSQSGRLLVWETRVVGVTSMPLAAVRAVAAAYWAYTMMNTLILVRTTRPNYPTRWSVLSHLPFTSHGNHLVQLASIWAPQGLYLLPGRTLFPPKFSNCNSAHSTTHSQVTKFITSKRASHHLCISSPAGSFHRALVNVTALPYKPYWDEEGGGSGLSATKRYSGADRLMLEAMALALNFTIYVLPVETWDQVVTLVEQRVSFVASVVHMILQNRLERFGFTCTYEHSINLAFGMAKPSLMPRWQSLYYPLTDEVWAAILLLVLIMPPVFYLVRGGVGGLRAGAAVLMVFGALMGQPLPRRMSPSSRWRAVLGAWLWFTLIVSVAYRGNLMAFLALPKYPARPEDLVQLVRVVDRITMPSYGSEFLSFLKQSESPSFRAWGDLMTVGVAVVDGLKSSLTKKQAHVDGRRYLELVIAEHFTLADGTTRLYVGREGILPGLNAWPIPHDAPYREAFDRVINAVIEAGLYNKWMGDILTQTRHEAQRKLRQEVQSGATQEATPEGSGGSNQPLTLVHLQGPIFLLLVGLLIACLAFVVEAGLSRLWRRGH